MNSINNMKSIEESVSLMGTDLSANVSDSSSGPAANVSDSSNGSAASVSVTVNGTNAQNVKDLNAWKFHKRLKKEPNVFPSFVAFFVTTSKRGWGGFRNIPGIDIIQFDHGSQKWFPTTIPDKMACAKAMVEMLRATIKAMDRFYIRIFFNSNLEKMIDTIELQISDLIVKVAPSAEEIATTTSIDASIATSTSSGGAEAGPKASAKTAPKYDGPKPVAAVAGGGKAGPKYAGPKAGHKPVAAKPVAAKPVATASGSDTKPSAPTKTGPKYTGTKGGPKPVGAVAVAAGGKINQKHADPKAGSGSGGAKSKGHQYAASKADPEPVAVTVSGNIEATPKADHAQDVAPVAAVAASIGKKGQKAGSKKGQKAGPKSVAAPSDDAVAADEVTIDKVEPLVPKSIFIPPTLLDDDSDVSATAGLCNTGPGVAGPVSTGKYRTAWGHVSEQVQTQSQDQVQIGSTNIDANDFPPLGMGQTKTPTQTKTKDGKK
jgi:hypothetical protein